MIAILSGKWRGSRLFRFGLNTKPLPKTHLAQLRRSILTCREQQARQGINSNSPFHSIFAMGSSNKTPGSVSRYRVFLNYSIQMFLMPPRNSSRGASCGAAHTNRARCSGNWPYCNWSNCNGTMMNRMARMHSRRIMLYMGSWMHGNGHGSHTSCHHCYACTCHGNRQALGELILFIFFVFHEFIVLCFSFYERLNTKMILRRQETGHSNQRQRLRCADSRY